MNKNDIKLREWFSNHEHLSKNYLTELNPWQKWKYTQEYEELENEHNKLEVSPTGREREYEPHITDAFLSFGLTLGIIEKVTMQ